MSICHRDIKPENILLDQNDNVILIDFGTSVEFEQDNDETMGTVGSMLYFAPEIVASGSNKTIKARRTDIWALGVTLYNLATNKYPFTAKSIPGLQNKILNEEPDFSLI